ncbi:unnamed protein product [Adineta ricciae]|uniref:Phospholipid-transporting ATPase n=1 Tax=Adineta ricciae TaxID=249248 RepID=A0A815DVU1_ADIRI|nr:unnamed protein product [Adineta ricciae]
MGNCTAVPTLRRTPHISRTQSRRATVSSITNGAQVSVPRSEPYIVHHNVPSPVESPIWVAIKNRRRHKPHTNRIKTTRYNILTFIPKNLFEQFRRVANVYFAILIGLNWIPIVNALSKQVAFIPLTVILTITAIKDLVEDLKRWRSDAQINKQIAQVYDKKTKTFIPCKWQDLSVGNVVRVRTDETVPADILLLSSASTESTCYLDTAAIDGETNLKQKSIPSCFLNLDKTAEETSFELQCDPPNDDIYRFCGRLLFSTGSNACPCDNNNFLLRGCVLRITEYVDGLIVYAGNETKIIKSSRQTISKHALIERYINRDVLFSSLILTTICLLCAGLSIYWERSFGDKWTFVPFIVDDPFDNSVRDFFANTLRFVILFQVMVPIALYVSLDLVRVLQMYTIARDKHLKYEHPISCRTFTINEDLGQIGYVFTDKTGTLTQNKLVFKMMSVGGIYYSGRSELPEKNDPLIQHFLTTLAICNTSFIVHDHPEFMHRLDYQPKYEGDNADDLVLCQTASQFGVRMISRSAQTITVRYLDSSNSNKQDLDYDILCLLPFDSTRKRMSIIVRLNDQIFLYIKGAESSIWPHLSPLNDTHTKSTIEQHSLTFAEQGYRSLLVAYRQLTLREFESWFERYRFAANALDNREEAISDAATEIEVDLMLAGLTAVEDKLQDGVPRAIATLRCAGIKLWLLTGDKQATALSTAQAASLINIPQTLSSDSHSTSRNIAPAATAWDFDRSAQARLNQHTHMIYYSSQLIEIDQQLRNRESSASDDVRTEKTISRMREVIAAQASPVSLVVTGEDLSVILRYKPKEFIRAASECQSVLFCRVSATQKRELVSVAKSVFKHRILAIGDGANDVGMIRESHCGVAVYGREGSQAVAAGDFAVDRFECLRRLLLVHGAWCFTRTSELILYTFMHNCAYVFVIFFHQFFNGFSGAVSLHSFYLTLYSSLFTVLPQCAAALFDQHVPAERALHEPQLYQYTLHARCYRMWSYWINILDAIWQSSVIFFFAYLSYRNEFYIDVSAFGFSIAFSMIVTSLIHVLLQTSRVDISIISSIAFSFLVFLGFTLVFDETCVVCIPGESPYQVSYHTLRKARFWFTTALTIFTAMLPRFTIKCLYNTIRYPFAVNYE